MPYHSRFNLHAELISLRSLNLIITKHAWWLVPFLWSVNGLQHCKHLYQTTFEQEAHYSGTPLKGHPWVKDTPLKGHFCLCPKWVKLVLYRPLNKGHLFIKDRNKFPNGVRLREAPLYFITNSWLSNYACNFHSTKHYSMYVFSLVLRKRLKILLKRNNDSLIQLGELEIC